MERVTVKRFISIFQAAGPIEAFDSDLYFKLIEKMTVHDDTKLILSLLDGSEIECEI
ncbi:hypothetical protein [Desulfosporosinus sp. Sb-LF]|uniref:hypothetical protein n=1 Tax=Desulfosporosinus sp. Sb-LF TaxID=2560027 RepID=UPI001FB140C0|nr:hypothetical protein [Desulfosporosinus sp. Sb-LF]